MPSKPRSKPAASSFDEWLAKPQRRVRSCVTCSTCEAAIPLIAKYVEKARRGDPVPPMSLLHQYLVENAGYTMTTAALGKHIRDCLGYSSRAR